MKFLYLTDTHLTARGPKSRTDNYVEALFEKFDEIKQVVKDEKIDVVFHGGDLFDKPAVSIQLTGRVARLIKSTKVPWTVVPGNHDLFGYNLSSLPQTSLGLLAQAGIIEILDRKAGPVNFMEDAYGISFEGQEYHMDIDKRAPELDYHVDHTADKKVLIPHSMLLPKDYFPEVPHTVSRNLVDKTKADLILVGHYHDGFIDKITHSDGHETTILNPGSVMRDEASKCNLTRVPQYIVLEWANGVLTHDIRPFECAVQGTDIFDRSHISAKQTKNRYLESFQQRLTDEAVTAVDVRTVLDELIDKSPDLSDLTIDKAREELEEAEKTIDEAASVMEGYTEKSGPLSIKSLHIKGFQSHEDTTIHFEEGLNAITGPSDSGKSSVIRALRFALYNEPRGSDFIRQSSSKVAVKVEFSDGSFLERERTASSAGSYIVGKPDGTTQELKGFTNQIPVDIADTHQMPMLQLAKDILVSLNIGYQLDPPFLIGESPSTRAAVIGRLTGANLVDTAVRETGRKILANSREQKVLEEQLSKYVSDLLPYTNLDDDIKKVAAAKVLYDSLDEKERVLTSLKTISASAAVAETEEAMLNKVLAGLTSLKRLAPEMRRIENLSARLQLLKRLSSSNENLSEEEGKHMSFLSSLPYTELVQAHDSLEEKRSLLSKLTSLNEKLNLSKKEEAELVIRVNQPIPDIALVDKLKKLSEIFSNVRKVNNELATLSNSEREHHILLAMSIERIALKQGKYQEMLTDLGVCPTCDQNIINDRSHAH